MYLKFQGYCKLLTGSIKPVTESNRSFVYYVFQTRALCQISEFSRINRS
jgi:hypothetical protein